MKNRPVATVIALVFAFASTATQSATQINFLRHAEVDMTNPDKPLVEAGKQRAAALAQYFDGTNITHIFVTNYERNKDTGSPLAQSKNLELEQIPMLGSKIDGKEVTNRSKGNVAIQPMLKALSDLPDGSVAVVIGNSGNLYPIMSKYGVTNLPCPTKKCFPKKEFDNIWVVTNDGGSISMTKAKYGH